MNRPLKFLLGCSLIFLFANACASEGRSNYSSEHAAWGGNGGWWGGENNDWAGERGWPDYRYDEGYHCPHCHAYHRYVQPIEKTHCNCNRPQNNNTPAHPYNDTVPGAGLYINVTD